MPCCRSPACRQLWLWDCSARQRCLSRSRLRAAGPTRWPCASGPSSPIPGRWRRRLAGAAGGAGLILGLNTVRIGTLGRVAASPAWFNALHVYVWPAVLTLAIAGYVFGWMRLADRRQTLAEEAVAVGPSSSERPQPTRRFVFFTAAFLLLFSAASPLYLESTGVLALAGFIARAAAATLGIVGVSAHAAANVLWTPRGGFLVTQECISTPLIPVYLAAICAYSTTWRRLILGVLATAALHRPGHRATPGGGPAGCRGGLAAIPGARLLSIAPRRGGRVPRRAVAPRRPNGAAPRAGRRHRGRSVRPPARSVVHARGHVSGRRAARRSAGAIAFLPAFQVGLYLALWVAAFVAVGWKRFLAGLAVLELTQTAGLLALHALASHSGLTAHVRDVRGWAVAGPLIVAAVVNIARPRR